MNEDVNSSDEAGERDGSVMVLLDDKEKRQHVTRPMKGEIAVVGESSDFDSSRSISPNTGGDDGKGNGSVIDVSLIYWYSVSLSGTVRLGSKQVVK